VNENWVDIRNVSRRFRQQTSTSLKDVVADWRRPRRNDFWALRDVTLHIEGGTTVGLVGRNGSGKSTLLKIIAGILDPTAGTVSRPARIAALLELGAGFHPDMTGRENIFLNGAVLGVPRRTVERRQEEIIEFSGIADFIDYPVKHYSSGMYARLGFAIAIHSEPDLLIVDEVLAVGDEEFQLRCLARIREVQGRGTTVVLVTHDANTVLEFCTSAALLNHGHLEYFGPALETIDRYRLMVAAEITPHLDPSPAPIRVTGVGLELGEWPSDALQQGERFIHPGQSLEFIAILVADELVSAQGYVVGFSVWSDDGVLMLEWDSHHEGLVLPALNPGETVRVRFLLPGLQLSGGHYRVEMTVAPDITSLPWQRLPFACDFVMASHSNRTRARLDVPLLSQVEPPVPALAAPGTPTSDEPAPGPAVIRPRLVINGVEHPLTMRETIVGRGAAADIRVPDTSVSRTHLRISVGETIEVVDLGSSNGTRVNGVAQSMCTVVDGDVVDIGATRIRILAG